MDDLTIYFKPLGGLAGTPVERACYADVGLAVGDQWLTFLEDRIASTTSNYLRASVHQLAIWFASNWWRLRWEPETFDWATNIDWRMSHTIASAGGGFIWPNVLFASDGDFVTVASRPRINAAVFEPIRYLNEFDGRIFAADFESKVDGFVEGVIARLHSMDIKNDSLSILWREVMMERGDPQATQWRKLEAMAGYDPDEAPAALEAKLVNDQVRLGKSAVEEVAAEAKHDVDRALQSMRAASRSNNVEEGGFGVVVPRLDTTSADVGGVPWQNAASLAAQAREAWGLGKRPIRNKLFADLLNTSTAIFSDRKQPKTRTAFAVRKRKNGAMNVYLQSPHPAGKRFSLARLIGDHLYFGEEEKLLPATRTRTSRQKFQRAFAQELLCPYDALLEKIQTERPGDDDIEEAAKYFHVSPLLVKTALVNKGTLDRYALDHGP